MDLDDLKNTHICKECNVLFFTEEEVYLRSQEVCKRCKKNQEDFK